MCHHPHPTMITLCVPFTAQVTRDHSGSIVVEVAGDGFLYHMVRKVTAALVEVGAGRLSLDQLQILRDQGAQ